MPPKITLIWLNYNGARIANIIKESLAAIKELNYPNLEVIVLDNGSTDGSFRIVEEFASKLRVKTKLVKLERNLGYCGGNNVAFKVRDPDSKYIVLLNNDAIPYPDSLIKLVEVMEQDKRIGAAQGMIMDYSGKVVDTAGDMIDELLGTHPMLRGSPAIPFADERYITYADGAYCVLRVDAVKRATGGERLFDDDMFAYYDDFVLGLKLWNTGSRVIAVPVRAARHKRGASFKRVKPLQLYLSIRGWLVLNEISNSRYRNVVRAVALRRALTSLHLSRRYSAVLIRAIADSMKIGRRKRASGERIDLYKAPLLKLGIASVALGIACLRLMDRAVEQRARLEWIKKSLPSIELKSSEGCAKRRL